MQQSTNYVVYFLRSQKDDKLYIGKTNNLDRRIAEHRQGQVSSTKARRPLILLGYETCQTEQETLELERIYKKGYKREELRRRFNL